MSKNNTFATELQSISSSVDRDVGRVMTLLRDDATVQRQSSEPPVAASSVCAESFSGELSQRDHGTRTSTLNRSVSHPDDNGKATLENVTTRLRRETNERLSDAALRQKLARHKPDSRQDIIEEAVCMWLREHGYLTSDLETNIHTPQRRPALPATSKQK